MKVEYKRYVSRPLFFNYYMASLYILAIAYAIGRLNKPLAVMCLFTFGLGFLSTFWSVKICIFQCFSYSPTGQYILFNGKLERIFKENSECESFFSNNIKMLLRKGIVTPLEPKVDYSISDIRKGVITPNYHLFPNNEFKVPRPGFLKMFKDQCVTPVFCFQVFSSLLMCFDEHIMNALFSTVIIVAAEASFVISRVSTMKIFRKLEQKTCEIKRIYKGDGTLTSEIIPSTLLKPGDKIVIDSVIDIPCDLIILEGSCAVNEAMLSGESVPLYKEEIIESKEKFYLNTHRKNFLFAGTQLEKIYSPLTCFVLRTSFNTEKGVLLNKMLHSEDIKYDQEALKFILLLSLISLGNSLLTFMYSKKSGYSLFLDIIILFTNSIPFELPMEMNMSIQTAVKALMAKKIYCLEPFRITLAGKVQVCCFDKTGTLVDSKLEVKKIEFKNSYTDSVLSCCHNLIVIDNEVKGDPLEMAIFSHDFEKVPSKILQQFSFTSELKRQAVVAELNNSKKNLVFCMKGAPEEVQKYLSAVPSDYNEYKKFATEGYRVIALAYRSLNINDIKLVNNRLSDRDYLERDMTFAGFVLLGSSLRHHAHEMCKTLSDAGLKVLMITGDNLLTALNVADQLNIKGKGVEGKDIEKVLLSKDFEDYAIFGRADPKHKEMIIKKWQSLGLKTMMVGDGTNDVGALKAADVGVAMLEGQEVAVVKKPTANMTLLEKLKAEAVELESIKPGDASIAAPFTVKSNSLSAIIEIIQQGRSSLVTTIQMYKILALNSIISAFFSMFVDILGIKFSDPQMLSLGILSSVAFTAITQPKSLNTISKQKPISSIFSLYMVFSILTQSFIQVSSLYLVYKNIPIPKPVETFEPSVMCTVLLVINCVQNITTILCNYIGRPFREDLTENKLLSITSLIIIGYIANITFKFMPDLNELLKVLDISKYNSFVIGISVSIFVLCLLSEKIAFRLFMFRK